MLSDEQIEMLTDSYIVDIYQQLEKEVIQDIARRVRKTGRLTETAEIMAKSMREQGYAPSKILSEVMKSLGATPEYKRVVAENTHAYKQMVKEEIKKTVEEAKAAGDALIAAAGDMAFNDDLRQWGEQGINLKEPNSMNQLLEALKKQTDGDLRNITQTMAFKNSLLGTTDIENAYQRALDVTLLKVSTGAFSYDAACKEVIKQFTDSGLRTVSYASGRTLQLDTAVRTAVRTGMSQLAGRITEANCKTTGQDLVIISQHIGCRDSHVHFQNRVYSMSGKHKKYPDIHAPLGEGCAYGLPEGLKGPNCRHNFYPFWEGISEIPKPIVEPPPKKYKGKEYDYYEATQKQRSMEREIRALKRERYTAASPEETRIIKGKIKAKTKEYKDFSEKMGIRPKENRLLAVGERAKYAHTSELRGVEQYYRKVITDKDDTLKMVGDKKAQRVITYANSDMYISEGLNIKPKKLQAINKNVNYALDLVEAPAGATRPRIVVVGPEDMKMGVYASYNMIENAIKVVDAVETLPDKMITYVHEACHWKEAQKYLLDGNTITEENFGIYLKYIESKAKVKIDKLLKNKYNIVDKSDYARAALQRGEFIEVYTEYKTYKIIEGSKKR